MTPVGSPEASRSDGILYNRETPILRHGKPKTTISPEGSPSDSRSDGILHAPPASHPEDFDENPTAQVLDQSEIESNPGSDNEEDSNQTRLVPEMRTIVIYRSPTDSKKEEKIFKSLSRTRTTSNNESMLSRRSFHPDGYSKCKTVCCSVCWLFTGIIAGGMSALFYLYRNKNPS